MSDSIENKVSGQCGALRCLSPSVESGLCDNHLLMRNKNAGKVRRLLGSRVYAIRTLSDPVYIKFGIARNVQRRRTDLQIASPFELEVLGAFRGTILQERALHMSLVKYRLRGEWFRYEGKAKEIADYFSDSNWSAIGAFLVDARGGPSFEEKLAAIATS